MGGRWIALNPKTNFWNDLSLCGFADKPGLSDDRWQSCDRLNCATTIASVSLKSAGDWWLTARSAFQ